MDLIEWLLDWEEKVDLCLALGTSMVGMNADRIPVSAANRAARAPRTEALGTVIVALQQTQYDRVASLRIFAPIDEVMELLAQELSLAVALAGSHMPPPPPSTMLADLPYDQHGRKAPGKTLTLDLRVGQHLRVVNQPNWDQQRHGGICEVAQASAELASEGHVKLLFPGTDGKEPVSRYLGAWWLEAAKKGEVEVLPVVP